MLLSEKQISEFRKIILDYYGAFGRSFPWRGGSGGPPDPWGVLVSEFMLQQTQTGRVISYWERWMKKWPRPRDLAAAPLEEILREWSGLGYNRRAKNLRECARIITERWDGMIPRTPEDLLALPGVGPYTAGAAVCFAWNRPGLFIETNIRSVLIHFFFQGKSGIRDEELLPILSQTLDASNPRVWYWALMDYGVELKKLTENPAQKSAVYVRQSPFEGSLRQIRGEIIRTLSQEGAQRASVLRKKIQRNLADMKKEDYDRAMEALEKEMMVAEEGGLYRIG
ncbi:MAG: A/G-specific adenine glycosylase [Treponema sp.]|jgi:A/G-specific adenine glycosylase|nr:A/G-specific adenine glycosylase [Treponema sp.]